MFARIKILILLLSICVCVSASNAQVIFQDQTLSYEEWDKVVKDYTALKLSPYDVNDLRDSLGLGIVGRNDSHTIIFIQPDTVIYPNGRVLITFPDQFDLEGLNVTSYADNDEGNTDYLIDSFTLTGQTCNIYLDDLGTPPISGSRIVFELDDIFNPTVSGDYQIILTVTDNLGQIVSGPQFSNIFTVSPGDLDSIQVFPTGVQQIRAGDVRQFTCSCYDSYSNEIDCPSQVWSLAGSTVTGDISQTGLFTAKYVAPFHVVCTVGELVDSSDLLFVVAGDLYTFNMTGFPDTIVAGKELDNSIYVEARDMYANRVRSYTGTVWFESSDTAAQLLRDSTNKYQFLEGDQGDKIFPDYAFIFNTAGLQTINVTDGSISSPLKYIIVEADNPAGFNVNMPVSVTAGNVFTIEISDYKDASGNLLSGVMDVTLLSDGTAPDGTVPIVNDINIVDGSGSAQQTLYKSGNNKFVLSIDTITRQSQQLQILSASAAQFDFELSSPQIVGVAFDSPATLTVLDSYENQVTNYNANTDTVRITPDGDGSVVNGVIGTSTAFVNGVCDLTQFGMYYDGSARFLKFKAQSKSGITANSETIEINSSSIEQLALSTGALYRGDGFSASVTISNYGSLPLTINQLVLNSSQGDMLIDSIVPSISYQISGNTSTVFEMYTSVPFTFNSEITRFGASFTGLYNQQTISDESDYLDSLMILSQQEATYVEGSLTPVVLSRGSSYSLRMKLKNLGDAIISLNTDSYLQFTGESAAFSANLEIPTYLPANGSEVDLFFEGAELDTEMESGKYQVSLSLSGLQGVSPYSEELILSDSITVQLPPNVSIVASSVSPASVYRGTQVSFALQVENDGEALFVVDPELSSLELTADGREVTFDLDEESDTIAQGFTTLIFKSNRIPSDFPIEGNAFNMYLQGEANDKSVNFSLYSDDNPVQILRQGSLQIMSTTTISANSPRVNTGQRFQVEVAVKNHGEENLENIWIGLDGESSLIAEDSIMIDLLEPDQTDQVLFNLTAADQSNPAEIFYSEIISSTGVSTGSSGIIMNPEDNTSVATIQTPASITAVLEITSPADALGGTVSINQDFTVEAVFENSGESEAGIGMARLNLPDGFTSDDDLDAAFEISDPVNWNITAPSQASEANIVVNIISAPDDLNTGEAAILDKSADSVHITVEENLPIAVVSAEFESYDLVYPGQVLPVMELEFTLDDASDAAKAIVSGLSFEFSDREGRAFDLSDLLLSGTVSYGSEEYNGTISSNQLSFSFGEEIVFDVSSPAVLDLTVTLSSETDMENFTVEMDSSNVSAHDYRFETVGSSLRVTGISGKDFAIERSYGAVQAEFEKSFYNYPNPFNPDRESTLIVYYLPADSDIDFTIYTLIGEKVFSTHFDSGEPGAQGGTINRFYWDGLNLESVTVLEGVYLAVIKYSGGEAFTKIAVVK